MDYSTDELLHIVTSCPVGLEHEWDQGDAEARVGGAVGPAAGLVFVVAGLLFLLTLAGRVYIN